MAKVKFAGLLVVGLLLIACGDSGAKTAKNSASSSGGEQVKGSQVAVSGAQQGGQEMEYDESLAETEEE
jgi:hypothetical protein